jgi:hypothetical protein
VVPKRQGDVSDEHVIVTVVININIIIIIIIITIIITIIIIIIIIISTTTITTMYSLSSSSSSSSSSSCPIAVTRWWLARRGARWGPGGATSGSRWAAMASSPWAASRAATRRSVSQSMRQPDQS